MSPEPCCICGELNYALYEISKSYLSTDSDEEVKVCHECCDIIDSANQIIYRAGDKAKAYAKKRLLARKYKLEFKNAFSSVLYSIELKSFEVVRGIKSIWRNKE